MLWAAFTLYVAALVWWLCHPLVSLSTGELKARQLYVDENAMVVQGLLQAEQDEGSLKKGMHAANYVDLRDKSMELRKNLNLYFGEGPSDYTCDHFVHVGATSCDTFMADGDDFLTQVVVDPVGTPLNGEAVTFAIAYDAETEKDAAQIGNTFIRRLLERSPWLSKRVLLIFVPSRCSIPSSQRVNTHISHVCDAAHGSSTLFSPALEQWLDQRHINVKRGARAAAAAGIIREAYVVNLAHTNKKDNGEVTRLVGKPLELRFNGVNGVLPNMDVVAGSLVLFSDKVAPRYDTHVLKPSRSPIHAWYWAWHSLVQVLSRAGMLPKAYSDNFLGMVKHAAALADGFGDGLHAQFLERNIDSISFHVRVDMTHDIPIMLTGVMTQLARVSSQLHEDLHHGHFFYLIMDNTHFVGLSEYVGPMGLALCSLITLWLYLVQSLPVSSPLWASSLGVALRCVMTDTGLLAAMIGAMVGMDAGGLFSLPPHAWKHTLTLSAGLLSVRDLVVVRLSRQEYSAYASLAVLLLLLVCFFVAGHHVALAFPILMTVVPLSWLVFVRTATLSGGPGTVLVYRVLALTFGPLCLFTSFNHVLDLWIKTWRTLGAENLPMLLLLSTVFMSGCLRFVAVVVNGHKVS